MSWHLIFVAVEFKCIKKKIHMSTCIGKYFYLILNSTTKKKLPALLKKEYDNCVNEVLIIFNFYFKFILNLILIYVIISKSLKEKY